MTTHSEVARVRAVFDDWARRGRADGMERSHGPAARLAFDRLEVAPGERFLDLGCGNGYAARWAASVDPSVTAVGVDVSPEMIDRARELSTGLPNATFEIASWPPAEPLGAFDAIFSMETFYYLPDVAAGLGAVHDALVEGGRFACVVDYYAENRDSHDWPEALGVSMQLLDEGGWRSAFEDARLVVVDQVRLRPRGEGPGSLLTLGVRAG